VCVVSLVHELLETVLRPYCTMRHPRLAIYTLPFVPCINLRPAQEEWLIVRPVKEFLRYASRSYRPLLGCRCVWVLHRTSHLSQATSVPQMSEG